ncbi:lysosomal acid lipase/cholesteryl ester hydrolase [Leptinotarsa decemlineata]|uniref:lysosomal acid lipase/cholesteryl ester hydrolase n=1 Tax=Leptinotarsa decemlineata TaxID=7539 RepID=UPI003D30A93F
MKQIVFGVFIFLSVFVYVYTIKVCETFIQYDEPNNKHCYDDPDSELNVTQIAKRRNYNVEEHFVTTTDGYILFLARIYKNQNNNSPIILGHTMLQPCVSWVNRPEKSLAFFLADQGFEVWIPSFRASQYSLRHKTLTINDDDFWKFSFYELGVYDLSALSKFVKKTTGRKALYVGYSTGSTASYVYASHSPREAKENLQGIISFSPAAYVKDMKSLFRYLLPLVPFIRPLVYQFGHGGLFPDLKLLRAFCTGNSFLMILCETTKVPFFGDNYPQLDPTYLPFVGGVNHDTFAVELANNLADIQKYDKFMANDYGRDENLKKYGESTPPIFKLSNIQVPVVLFWGENDWVATKPNVDRLYSELSENVRCGKIKVKDNKWNYNNFLEGKNIIPLLYTPLLETIQTLMAGKCLT